MTDSHWMNSSLALEAELDVVRNRLWKYECFYSAVAELTLHHDIINDTASVSPRRLGELLETIDPEWFDKVGKEK